MEWPKPKNKLQHPSHGPFHTTFRLVLISPAGALPASNQHRLMLSAVSVLIFFFRSLSLLSLFPFARIVCSLAVRFDDPLKVLRYVLNNFETSLKRTFSVRTSTCCCTRTTEILSEIDLFIFPSDLLPSVENAFITPEHRSTRGPDTGERGKQKMEANKRSISFFQRRCSCPMPLVDDRVWSMHSRFTSAAQVSESGGDGGILTCWRSTCARTLGMPMMREKASNDGDGRHQHRSFKCQCNY